MNNLLIFSDPHLGHNRARVYCDLPDNIDEIILERIHELVRPDTILLCLGDVSFYKHEYWNQRLTSIANRNWLIRGNHDKKSNHWYLTHGWDFVADSMELTAFGKKFLFTHIPTEYDGINVHGHLHNTYHHDLQVGRLVYLEPKWLKELV